VYPEVRRGDETVSFDVWCDLRPPPVDVRAGLSLWLESENWEQGFVPYLENFLRKRIWNTKPPPAKRANGAHQQNRKYKAVAPKQAGRYATAPRIVGHVS
jgi:hypothetical protein